MIEKLISHRKGNNPKVKRNSLHHYFKPEFT